MTTHALALAFAFESNNVSILFLTTYCRGAEGQSIELDFLDMPWIVIDWKKGLRRA